MKYVLAEVFQSPSGDIHEQEIAIFTSWDKLEEFCEKNIYHLKKRHFTTYEYVPLPVDPESFSDIEYHQYKECYETKVASTKLTGLPK